MNLVFLLSKADYFTEKADELENPNDQWWLNQVRLFTQHLLDLF